MGTACFNHPYRTITLTTTWAQYSVAFADATWWHRQYEQAPDARMAQPRRELGFSIDEISSAYAAHRSRPRPTQVLS
jgi:hypothetical protein